MLSTRRSAIAAAGGFSIIAAFQLALALGAPFGRAAWGGRYTTLPAGVRLASLVSMGVYLLVGRLILARGRVRRSAIPAQFVNRGTWVIVVLFSLGTVLNLASQSNWERYFWAPFAAILAVLSTRVARSPRLDARAEPAITRHDRGRTK